MFSISAVSLLPLGYAEKDRDRAFRGQQGAASCDFSSTNRGGLIVSSIDQRI